jgi:hypothetical protein
MSRLVNIAGYHADQRVREQKEQMIVKAKEIGWKHFVQDFPVSYDLMEFANAVKDVMPNVTFLPVDAEHISLPVPNSPNQQRFRIYNELSIVMDGYPFDLGRINFKDNAVKSNGTHTNTYGVYSRKIANAKYGTHRTQHNMIMSNDMKKAVKNVCKYVIPYSTRELAQAFYDNMQNHVGRIADKAQRALKDHCHPLGYNYQEVAEEIMHIKSQGIKFKNQLFINVAEGIEDVYTTYIQETTRKIGGTFVRIYKVGDQPYVSLQEIDDFRKHVWNTKIDMPTTDKPVSELPEDAVGSISVLSILENDQYVADVGMKLDSNHFWIQRG